MKYAHSFAHGFVFFVSNHFKSSLSSAATTNFDNYSELLTSMICQRFANDLQMICKMICQSKRRFCVGIRKFEIFKDIMLGTRL